MPLFCYKLKKMKNSFKRHIWNDLLAWKAKEVRKPLILRGARQVGKTTILRDLGATYDYFIELNLEKANHLQMVKQSKSVTELMAQLSLLFKIPTKKWNKTLLFIDEIQESSKAIGFLRYFYEEVPQLSVVAAGSLLEHSFGEIQQFPVGRVNYMHLFPLNFQEFLLATGNDLVLQELEKIPIKNVVHSILLQLFHTYCIVGGMPEVVAEYVKYKDFVRLLPIYESIWHTYKDDVVKYANSKTEQNVIKHIMNTSAAFVDKRVKFQNFGNSNYKSREVGEAFRALDQAKVIQIIYPSTVFTPPTIPDYKKSPRIQFLDTGLLNFDLNIQAQMLSVNDLSNTYNGAIIPHLITQEIISMNKSSYQKPCFWVRDKTQSSAEVDLLMVSNAFLIPIEIKSGATGSLKSLHQYIDRCTHHFAVRVYAGQFKIEKSRTPNGKLFYLMNLPYYLGTCLSQYLDYLVNKYKLMVE